MDGLGGLKLLLSISKRFRMQIIIHLVYYSLSYFVIDKKICFLITLNIIESILCSLLIKKYKHLSLKLKILIGY